MYIKIGASLMIGAVLGGVIVYKVFEIVLNDFANEMRV